MERRPTESEKFVNRVNGKEPAAWEELYARYYKALCAYSASLTGLHHSLRHSSPVTSTAIWLNQLSAFAPCQCLTFAGMVTTSPGVRLCAGLPSS